MSDSIQKGGAENEKLSSALNEIFSNPQMLSAISSMAQNLKSNAHTPTPAEESPPTDEASATASASSPPITDKLPDLLNMLSSNGSGYKQNHRSELLCALKPYLSQNRADAIDKIIRFSELSSVLKNLS